MNEHSIYIADWGHARVYLRSMFSKDTITQASRRDLERALVILAHAGEKDPWPKETENFRSTVTQLLQVRVAEELHSRSLHLSRWAIAVSVGSLLVSAAAVWLSVVWHPRSGVPEPQSSAHSPAPRISKP